MKVFVRFTVCSDDERDNTSPTEGIVGILEWTRSAIIAIPSHIWSKDLINPLNLSNVDLLRLDASGEIHVPVHVDL